MPCQNNNAHCRCIMRGGHDNKHRLQAHFTSAFVTLCVCMGAVLVRTRENKTNNSNSQKAHKVLLKIEQAMRIRFDKCKRETQKIIVSMSKWVRRIRRGFQKAWVAMGEVKGGFHPESQLCENTWRAWKSNDSTCNGTYAIGRTVNIKTKETLAQPEPKWGQTQGRAVGSANVNKAWSMRKLKGWGDTQNWV